MKKLAALLMVCCMLTACGPKEEPIVEVPTPTEEVMDVVEDTVVEVTEGVAVLPLPTAIDINALDNCMAAVSFDKGDAYVDDAGFMQLDVTVYTYDLYDMVAIANLKAGDTIVIQGNDVVIESLETLQSGLLLINGGMENGGYDLWHEGTGVYFEHGYNDAKAYYPIGKATIPVSADFEFVDSSDLNNGEVTYYPGDFLMEEAVFEYNFTPDNTTIVIENNQVIHMTRIAAP